MTASSPLATPLVVVVTGASRGAGKGIALALGSTGATVYVTGRSQQEGESPLPGTVFATADEITRRGGRGIAVLCDHASDAEVKALFEQVEREQGRLDILVNNAISLPEELTRKGPFWEKSLDMLSLLDVGMRSSYVASYYAAPLLLKSACGLLVNTSSFGGRCYMHGPAYGAGKAAIDKMAHDMAVEFKPHGVAAVSLWLGLLKSERTLAVAANDPGLYGKALAVAESTEFAGRVIDALARDTKRMERSGKVLVAAELAREYGITDIDGKQPPSYRKALGDPTTFSDAIVD
jgi:NAD(P)-dependent dehydrogenase (short-subunit alcohol dehydrogenase family)